MSTSDPSTRRSPSSSGRCSSARWPCLWLSAVRAVVRVLAVQGLALGAVAATLGFHFHDAGLIATAAVVVGIKAVLIPALLRRIGSGDATERERRPLVNVPASLVVPPP